MRKISCTTEDADSAYLVLEFIRGQDLLKILEVAGNKPFPFELVVEWGKELCDFLHILHTMDPPWVWRDVKPDNIMLLPDGRTIRVLDFGTAHPLGITPRDLQDRRAWNYTECYAPPEQIIGKPEPRSDLFALAGTLYHLVTGKAPEGFYTAKEIESHLSDPACTIPAQHRWFYKLLAINLSEEVHKRYKTALEIQGDLADRQVTSRVQTGVSKFE